MPEVDCDAVAFKEHVRGVLDGRVRQTLEDPALRCAAVLLPLLCKDGQWHVLVTQRTELVETHKGQISFPGGACDPGDTGLEATALREACEEIGLAPEQIEVLGALDDFPSVTYFAVTPFVGVIPYPFPYQLERQEVAAVVEVPLAFLREPGRLRKEVWERNGQPHDVYFWDYGDYTIWGLTARILKHFLDLIF